MTEEVVRWRREARCGINYNIKTKSALPYMEYQRLFSTSMFEIKIFHLSFDAIAREKQGRIFMTLVGFEFRAKAKEELFALVDVRDLELGKPLDGGKA